MSIASIPDIDHQKFDAVLQNGAKQIMLLCQQQIDLHATPARYIAHVCVPFDYDSKPVLCVHLTAVRPKHEGDTLSEPIAEADFRPDEARENLLLAALSLSIGADGVLRTGPMDAIPASVDAIHQECLAQAQAAWLCMHTGMSWSPDLRIDTIEPEWRQQWVMH